MIYLNQFKKIGPDLERDLLKYTKKALTILKCADKKVSITLCADDMIKKLNKQYRHKNKPTDVLSFPLNDENLLGDIIISLDTMQDNRARFATTEREELMFLIVHGLCHLLGHDHHKPEEEARMKKQEQKVLKILFGKNYHA